MTRKSYPSGAAPYSAALISRSVPSTPTRRTFTSTPRPAGTSDTDGLASSARCALFGFPGNTAIAFIMVSTLNQEFRDERRPACLMAGPDAGTSVAVEVFVKRNQVVPQGIVLKEVDRTEHRPPSLGVIEEDPREAPRDFLSHIPQ